MSVESIISARFNLGKLKENIEKLEIEFSEELDKGEGVHVIDIVSGAYGQYQQENIADFFEIKLDDDGIADQHDFIEEVADKLNELLSLDNGNVYFDYLESDGSYSLFYRRK